MEINDLSPFAPAHLLALPHEITLKILQYLNPKELIMVSLVCKLLKCLSSDDTQWKKLCRQDHYYKKFDLPVSCLSWKESYVFKSVCKKHLHDVLKSRTHPNIHTLSLDSPIRRVFLNKNEFFCSLSLNNFQQIDLSGKILRTIPSPLHLKYFDQAIVANKCFLTVCQIGKDADEAEIRSVCNLDLETGQLRQTYSLQSYVNVSHSIPSMTTLAADESSVALLLGSPDLTHSEICIWDIRQTAAPRFHFKLPSQVSQFQIEDNHLAVAYKMHTDETCSVWDLRKAIDVPFEKLSQNNLLAELCYEEGGFSIFPKCMAMDQGNLVVSYKNGEIFEWDILKGSIIDKPARVFPLTGSRGLKIDGSIIVCHYRSGLLRFIDRHSFDIIGFITIEEGKDKAFDFLNGVLVHQNEANVLKVYDFRSSNILNI